MTSNTTRRILIGCGALVTVAVLCGCAAVLFNVLTSAAGMPPILATVPPATLPVATSQPATSSPTDEPTPVLDSEPSGGLGATRAALEDQLADDFIAYFVGDRAWYIERQSASGLDADAEIRALIPTDSVLLDTYPLADGDRTARVYTSAWLAGLFGDEQWGGEDPGTFTVTFNSIGAVTRLVIATGENP